VIGCVIGWFFCSVLLFSWLLMIFWLFFGWVTLIVASLGPLIARASALIMRVTGLKCVSGSGVFLFLTKLTLKGIIIKVIATNNVSNGVQPNTFNKFLSLIS